MASSSVPRSFLCAITHDIMNEPMIDTEGNSYEKTAIMEWLSRNNTSPITRAPLYARQLNFNRALKDAIEEYKTRNGMTTGQDTQQPQLQPQNEEKIVKEEVNDNEMVFLETKTYKNVGKEVYVNIDIKTVDGNKEVSKDIVVVVDVSGSMGDAAKVNDMSGNQVDVGFTLLDITKHGLNTIVESLGNNDRLSIVTFSNDAKVIADITIATDGNKRILKNKINNLRTEGSTNLWEGIKVGLQQFSKIKDSEYRVQALLILTDGVPSSHFEPTRGIIETLKHFISKYKPEETIPTIYTYGFGYSLDTRLLSEIASIGKGNFSFIPDSGFVGTVFVNSIANISTTIGRTADLYFQPVNGAIIKDIIGYNGIEKSSVGTIHYGQSKTLVLKMELPEENYNKEYLWYSLGYTGLSGKYIDKQSKGDNNYRDKDDEFSKNLLRLEFVDLGFDIIKNDVYKIDESKLNVDKFVNKTVKRDNKLKSNPIMIDIDSQVKLAVSNTTYYNKWGKNYIYSFISAHKQQRCNNFKDKSVQEYGGTLFKDLRDKYDDIFNSMLPPVPSRHVNVDNGKTSNTTVQMDMSRFNNVDNGCYHEDSKVHMANGTYKKCSEIVKGDEVLTLYGKTKVLCVVKSDCKDNKCEMNMFESGLMITPYHPIYYNNDWVFPTNINNNKYTVECSSVYSYLLEGEHTIIINNIVCITLGHNSEHAVLKHEYFGKNVVEHLKGMRGYDKGQLHFKYGSIKRDKNNDVIGFDETRLNTN